MVEHKGDEATIEYILVWLERYFQNRKIMDRTIGEIEKGKDEIIVLKKDGSKKIYSVIPVLSNVPTLDPFISSERSIVTLNTKENFSFVVSEWKRFQDVRHFSIMFVNPFSRLDKKWVVFPSTHHMISEGKGIRKGLQSLYENVEPISIKEFETIVKSES